MTLAAPVQADLSYGGKNFNTLAAESYTLAGLKGNFTDWLDAAYLKTDLPVSKTAPAGQTLRAALDARKAELGTAKGEARDTLARDTAVWAHTFIKKAVPKFSLERGFEFASMATTGERQCLLQSVVIAGLLQRAGLSAGLVMVWNSQSGQESNLGHVTSVLRLPGGAGDLEIDASEPTPTATHSGVLAWADGSYRFLNASFGPGDVIGSYAHADGKGSVKPAGLTFLSLNYVRSQFDYYRGERAIGGLLGTGTGKATPGGLKLSEKWLKAALTEEPNNALAAGVLGNVWRKEGRMGEARTQYLKAAGLYAAQGHMPTGMVANLQWAKSQAGR
ncbi:hypothetical protein [Deinococcus saxicola]|uniref:hypothetical protein n=1 Tax=Deinococcus saxicola TaxID=249406 RepID=UPI0039EE256B